jgi:hypothetical protein
MVLDTPLFLATLRERAEDPAFIPCSIQGQVMVHFTSLVLPLPFVGHNKMGAVAIANAPYYTGRDSHSCTSTAAGLAHFLAPPPPAPAGRTPRTLSKLYEEASARDVALFSDANAAPELVRRVLDEDALTLLVFSTAPHKFTVLCGRALAAGALLLHSNQDDTRGGRRFTLAQHLRDASQTPLHLAPAEVLELTRRIEAAVCGAACHEEVFAAFCGGARFRRGHPSDYWVVALPVTLDVPTTTMADA